MDVDRATIRRAVIALFAHVEKQKEQQKTELIQSSHTISVQFGLRKIPDKHRQKPLSMYVYPQTLMLIDSALPHSLRQDTDSLEMCLFIKDEDKDSVKAQLKATPIPGLTKVMSLKKLKSQFARFEDRRKLCASYDIFLADDRIIPSLSKPLGKIFYARKKQPVPIRIQTTNFRQKVETARDSTFLFLSQGPCVAVKLGHTLMDVEQVVDNIVAGIAQCVDRIPRKWKNIQAIHVKTQDSIALPILNILPEATKLPPVKKLKL